MPPQQQQPGGAMSCIQRTCARCYYIPVRILCIAIIALQGASLNYYMVWYENNLAYCAWAAADIIIMAVFIAAFVFSSTNKTFPVKVTKWTGERPFSVLAWFLYSSCMAARVGIIFWRIAPTLKESAFMGPNVLKITLGCAAMVYLLLVFTHLKGDAKSKKQNYIDHLCQSITIDILDLVSILEVLFMQVSGILLPYTWHKGIIAIGCINLILPTLPTIVLSRAKFEDNATEKSIEVLHQFLYISLVNMPLFIVRMLIWHVHDQGLSLFVVKNIIAIVISVKKMCDQCPCRSKPETDGGNMIEMQDQDESANLAES